MQSSQSNLALEINKKLEADERTGDAGIEALNNNGVVTLTGTAESEEASVAAEEITYSQDGVLSVINDIEVVHDSDTVLDGRVIPPAGLYVSQGHH